MSSNDRTLLELHVVGSARRAFTEAAAQWQLGSATTKALLHGAATPIAPEAQSTISLDELERISHVLTIFRLLGVLQLDPQNFLHQARKEAIYGGRSPLQLMILPNLRGLQQVAKHLKTLAGEEI